jgi:4-azaleucine resistance transporter AzlC
VTTSTIDRSEVRRGFVAMLPLWLGVVPFALAFAILARTSGLSVLETEALSVLVFAGSAQLAFVNLVKDGAGGAVILLTVLLLNLRHVLYGLSLNSHLPARTRPSRPVLAALMTDESYGLTIRAFLSGRGSAGYFFGASLSLFISYATATLAGALFGSWLPDPERLGLETVFPLSFLALLLLMVRTRLDVAIATVAGGMALLLSQTFSGGMVVLTTTIGGAALGTLLDRRTKVG